MKAAIELPSVSVLRTLFDYNYQTGVLTRKHNTKGGKGKAGDAVGCPNRFGHLRVKIKDKGYAVHRVIWKWVTGEDPGDKVIDHINTDPADNRWCNLRLVDHSTNCLNSDRKNKSKVYPGVHMRNGRWVARIGVDYKRIHLGYFPSMEEAIKARKQAEAKLAAERNDTVLSGRSR